MMLLITFHDLWQMKCYLTGNQVASFVGALTHKFMSLCVRTMFRWQLTKFSMFSGLTRWRFCIFMIIDDGYPWFRADTRVQFIRNGNKTVAFYAARGFDPEKTNWSASTERKSQDSTRRGKACFIGRANGAKLIILQMWIESRLPAFFSGERIYPWLEWVLR